MRKLIVLPLLVLLAGCADQATVGPEGLDGGDVLAAKGGNHGKPPEEPPPANPDPAIAFNTYGRNTGYCVRVMNADGSNDTRLICGSGALYPSWSPPEGGSMSIAFTKRWGTIQNNGEYELWRLDATVVGGVPQWSEVGPLATCAGEPAWSPGLVPALGVEVIAYPEASYAENCRNNVLSYVPASGCGTEPCAGALLHQAPLGVRVSAPTWSPDAASIAFIVQTPDETDPPGDWSIKILDIATPATSLVFPGGDQYREIWDLEWSRSNGTGDRLAFSAAVPSGTGRKGRTTRYVYTLEVSRVGGSWTAGALTQVIKGTDAAWSPDNAKLLVNSGGDLVTVDLADYSTEMLRDGGFHPDWRR